VPKIHDISQPIRPGIRVWPGDRPYERAWTARLADGASCNVGHVAMSCHTGTHMDAPYHFAEQGGTAETIPLEACIGPAVVVPLERLEGVRARRILVRSGGGVPTVAAIERLPGLELFGIDGPSVDAGDSKTLDVHHALWKRGAVILEGLDLSAVADGEYQLIALPLRLAGMDGSPVRAVLLEP